MSGRSLLLTPSGAKINPHLVAGGQHLICQAGCGQAPADKQGKSISNRMRSRTFVVGVALALALFLFAQRHSDVPQQAGFRGVLDLTHASASGESVKLATRMEAPAHLMPGTWTVGQVPPERLIAPLVVLDVTVAVRANPDYQIGVQDIANWEQANGQIPMGAVVVARTGWDTRSSSANAFRNRDGRGLAHFPGYSEDAARFLVEARNVRGLGIDTPSIDPGSSPKPAVAPFTLAHGVYHLENVANLDRTPPSGALLVVAPSKLESRAQAPVRLFALTQ